MPLLQPALAPAPGELYLRALWTGRWLFLLIVGVFVGGSLIVTALLPKTYSSNVILSVRPAAQLEPAAMLYGSAMVATQGFSDSLVEQGPRRFVRRFQAPTVVAAAARDTGVIGPNETIEERQVRRWVAVENVEKTDLMTMTVSQPTAEGARKFAAALVARAIEASRAEAVPDSATKHFLEQELARADSNMSRAESAIAQAGAQTGAARELAIDRAKLELTLARDQYAAVRKRLDLLGLIVANQQFQLLIVDPPTLPLTPSFPRPLLNVSIGLILGVLAATTFIVLRSVLQSN